MPEFSAITERVINDLIAAYEDRNLIPATVAYPPLSGREASYFIQDQVAKHFQDDPIRAWKVGAAARDQTPYCAPIFNQNIFHQDTADQSVSHQADSNLNSSKTGTLSNHQSGIYSSLDPLRFHERGMESELCFVLATDLPKRESTYTMSDLAAAIGTVEVVMELVDSRLEGWRRRDPLLKLADNQMNGALIIGDKISVDHWQPLDFASLQAQLFINDEKVVEGKHVLNDPIGSLPWLANHLAERQGGLRQGDRIITGSWTGMQFVEPDARVHARFNGLGSVEIDFARLSKIEKNAL